MLSSLPHGAVNLKVLLIIIRINIDFNGPQIHHVISLATQHRCKQGWCHTFFPCSETWVRCQRWKPVLQTNRIKASGSQWSIGGSWRNPRMCKALSGPFMGTVSLKQRGSSGGCLLQVGKVKMVCPKALQYFQFPQVPGPHGREGERGCHICSHLKYSFLILPRRISNYSHLSHKKLVVTIMGFGVRHRAKTSSFTD